MSKPTKRRRPTWTRDQHRVVHWVIARFAVYPFLGLGRVSSVSVAHVVKALPGISRAVALTTFRRLVLVGLLERTDYGMSYYRPAGF